MKRTQIYIDENTFAFLEKESKAANKTISELIRASIQKRSKDRKAEIMKKMQAVFGIWADRTIDVNSLVRGLRRDRKV